MHWTQISISHGGRIRVLWKYLYIHYLLYSPLKTDIIRWWFISEECPSPQNCWPDKETQIIQCNSRHQCILFNLYMKIMTKRIKCRRGLNLKNRNWSDICKSSLICYFRIFLSFCFNWLCRSLFLLVTFSPIICLIFYLNLLCFVQNLHERGKLECHKNFATSLESLLFMHE